MIAPLWLVSSLAGRRALVVPLAWCGPCGQALPVDHDCPAVPIRPGLEVIRARTRETAPAATDAADDAEERTTTS